MTKKITNGACVENVEKFLRTCANKRQIPESELRAEAERLIASGQMPSLETVREAMREAIQSAQKKIKRRRKSKAIAVRPNDYFTKGMIERGIPLTQKNWLALAYFGAKSSIEELSSEEQEDLPEGFRRWPKDELPVN